MNALQTARGLGWFSLALGAGEIFGGRSLSQTLGVRAHTKLIRAYGLREIATGVGLLAQPDPTPWMWGRVAGDVLDLATLGAAFQTPDARPKRIWLALGFVAGVLALDVAVARALEER